MKSISQGTERFRIRSAMKKTAPLITPTSSSSRIRSCRRASSISTWPTPASTSVCDTSCGHPLGLDDPRDRDDLVAAYDEWPAFTVGARDLCVHEHILDLLRAAREPVSRTPP